MNPLTTCKNIYFIGIGGIGMSALARYFNTQGVVVAGYDKTPTDLTQALEKEGIKINPKKYRYLKLCIDEVPIAQPSQGSIINQPQPDPEPILPASLKQKTLRVL